MGGMKGIFLAGLAGALAATPAFADVLCKKKSGVVVVRTTCKKKETALDPTALGLQGPKGDKGDTGAQGDPGGFVDALPSGKSLVGFTVLSGSVANARIDNAISFPVPVSEDLVVEVVKLGDPPHLNCQGNYQGPAASPGYLCIYENTHPAELGSLSFYPTYGGGHPAENGISVYAYHDGSATSAILYLSWAATQP